MRQHASDAGRKVVGLLILLAAAWVLFKVVLGVVTAIAWIVVAVLAVGAIVWAIRLL